MGYSTHLMIGVAAVLLVAIANAMPPPAPVKSETTWCVANPNQPEQVLVNAKNRACGQVDCKPVDEPNGKCREPNNLVNHASYAITKYYSRTGDCDFAGATLVVSKNPSPNEKCRFPSFTGKPGITQTPYTPPTQQSAPAKPKKTGKQQDL